MALPAYEKRAICEFLYLLVERHHTVGEMESMVEEVISRMQNGTGHIDRVGIGAYVVNVFERLTTAIPQSMQEIQPENKIDPLDKVIENTILSVYNRLNLKDKIPLNILKEHREDLLQEANKRIAAIRNKIELREGTYTQAKSFIWQHAHGAMLDYIRDYITDYSGSEYARTKKENNRDAMDYMKRSLVKLDLNEYADVLIDNNDKNIENENNIARDRLRKKIQQILRAERCNDNQIRAFTMIFFDDMSKKEVAHRLGIAPPSVFTYVAQVISILKKYTGDLKQTLKDIAE